ncbi:hypothetical protein [Clostridium sp.]|uniref:hypothetical protein n=1 Tax=Clostridium sp. TaxID=1506 RepID=UPI003F4C04A3
MENINLKKDFGNIINNLENLEEVIEFITNYKFTYRLINTAAVFKDLIENGDAIFQNNYLEVKRISKVYEKYNTLTNNIINNFRFNIYIEQTTSGNIKIKATRTFIEDLNLFLSKTYKCKSFLFDKIQWSKYDNEICTLYTKDAKFAEIFLTSFFKTHTYKWGEVGVNFNIIELAIKAYEKFQKNISIYLTSKREIELQINNIFNKYINEDKNFNPYLGDKFLIALKNEIIYNIVDKNITKFNSCINDIFKIKNAVNEKEKIIEELTFIYYNYKKINKEGYFYAFLDISDNEMFKKEGYDVIKIGTTKQSLEVRKKQLFEGVLGIDAIKVYASKKVPNVRIIEQFFKIQTPNYLNIRNEFYKSSIDLINIFLKDYNVIEEYLQQNYYAIKPSIKV